MKQTFDRRGWMDLRGADFQQATLEETDFSGANIDNASFFRAKLNGADFSGAQVGQTNFSQATMLNTILNGIVGIAPDFSQAIQGFRAQIDEDPEIPEVQRKAVFFDLLRQYWMR